MKARTRLIFGVASQATMSVTTLLIVIVLARTQVAATVGAWAMAFAIVTLATTLVRSSISTSIVLSGAKFKRRDISGGFTATWAASLLVSCAVLSVGAVGLVRFSITAALAVSTLFSLPQDFLRYSWIARGLPQRALILDVFRLGTQGATTALCFWLGEKSAEAFTLTWGAGALVSVFVGCAFDRYARLSIRYGKLFFHSHRSDAANLLGESSANAIPANLQPYILTLFVGYAAAGALRVSQSFYAPLTTLEAGLKPVVLRELSSNFQEGRSSRKIRTIWYGCLGGTNLLYGTAMVLMPQEIGSELAGDSWPLVAMLLLPLAVQALLRPPLAIATLSLRASRRLALLRATSWILLMPSLLWPAVLGALWGVQGAGWGLAADITIRAGVYSFLRMRKAR